MKALTKWKYLLDTTEKSGPTTKILGNYTNSMDDKQNSILSYIMIFTLYHIPGKINTRADILSRKDQVNMKKRHKDAQEQIMEEKMNNRSRNSDIEKKSVVEF